MQALNRTNFKTTTHPERVIQFGEGNFLRAFIDWMIEETNKAGHFNGSVVVVQPIPQGLAPVINQQDGLFTLVSRGLKEGKPFVAHEIISSISRGLVADLQWNDVLACAENPDIDIMVSNTTEAGITYVETDTYTPDPPQSFPAKVSAYLYHRYKTFNGDPTKGMLIIPCELIDDNGDKLQEYVIKHAQDWQLEAEFIQWLKEANLFCNTLELGYEDLLLNTSELYHLFVIEADQAASERFPLHKTGLNVKWVDDLSKYRLQKVRVLNGAHTATYALAYLSGFDHVREATEDHIVGEFLNSLIFSEIIPTVAMDPDELARYATSVIERFKNPFIQHRWLDISLNAVAKFRARILPSLLPYLEKEQVPPLLGLALAALIRFYRGEELSDKGIIANYNDRKYTVQDDRYVLEFFHQLWQSAGDNYTAISEQVLSQKDFWGIDLTKYPNLVGQIAQYLESIENEGMTATIKNALDAKTRSNSYA